MYGVYIYHLNFYGHVHTLSLAGCELNIFIEYFNIHISVVDGIVQHIERAGSKYCVSILIGYVAVESSYKKCVCSRLSKNGFLNTVLTIICRTLYALSVLWCLFER